VEAEQMQAQLRIYTSTRASWRPCRRRWRPALALARCVSQTKTAVHGSRRQGRPLRDGAVWSVGAAEHAEL